ncbi:MaoC family dehydratase [Novosphingopyxis sp.]|uniref:MaoC family dehydratase n=1 Tax=Novosphingopyxis sp. TaxID=2709690 RepID=UPI003B5ADBE3
MKTYQTAAELAATVGEKQGPSGWLMVTQEMIDTFAKASGDYQWIHVDTERAATEMPDGKTIAHGFLVMSLVSTLQPHIYVVNSKSILNVGVDRLRFLSSVPVGSRIRLWMEVLETEEKGGGLRIAARATIEMEGAHKPALIYELILLYFD